MLHHLPCPAECFFLRELDAVRLFLYLAEYCLRRALTTPFDCSGTCTSTTTSSSSSSSSGGGGGGGGSGGRIIVGAYTLAHTR